MISAKVKVTSRIPDIVKAIQRATDQGLTAGAEMIESEAKRIITENKSVDTGRLRGSLSYTVNGGTTQKFQPVPESESDDPIKGGKKNVAIIGTNVFYGKFIEFGTSRMKERPFLRPAYDQSVTRIKALFRALYAKAVK